MTNIAETAELVWGYSMADINRIARIAVSKHRYSHALDWDDRLAAAWHGIVVELYGRSDPPTFTELLHCGIDEIGRDHAARNQLLGRPNADGQSSVSFVRYWGVRPSSTPLSPKRISFDDGFSEQLCEHMALHDVLGVLTGLQYEALVALAAFDNDGPRAARSLGIKMTQFNNRLFQARVAIKRAWFDDETPPKRQTGTTCRSGHSRAKHGQYRPSDKSWHCLECKRRTSRNLMRQRREAARTERLATEMAG